MSRKYMPWITGIVTAVAVFVLIGMQAGATTSLFSDGFESGDFSNWTSTATPPWTVNGTTAHSGVKRATAAGPGSGALVKQQSTAGFENIQLSYWYRIQSALESGDHVWVQWSTDGATWNQVADHTGTATSSFQFASWALPAGADDMESFEFRFYASLGNSSDVFWLDDVELMGNPIPIATPTPTDTPTPTPSPTGSGSPAPSPSTTPTPAHFPDTNIDDPGWMSNFHDYIRNFFLRLVHKASEIR